MIANAAFAVLLGVCWGLNWPAARLALDGFPPFTFRALGFAGGAALLFGFNALRGGSAAVPRRHWLRLATVGFLTVVGYNLLSAYAQLSASTARAAVLAYTMPIWTVPLAAIVLGERLDARRLVGVALGAAGLSALAGPVVAAGTLSFGLLCALGCAIMWAAGSVFLKRFPIDAPPLVCTAWQLAAGALVTGVGALVVDGLPRAWPEAGSVWAGLAYNVVIGQAFATTLWYVMLGRMPAGIAALATLLVPGVGVVGATLLLGEQPPATDWIGLALILTASAVVLIRPAASRPAAFLRA